MKTYLIRAIKPIGRGTGREVREELFDGRDKSEARRKALSRHGQGWHVEHVEEVAATGRIGRPSDREDRLQYASVSQNRSRRLAEVVATCGVEFTLIYLRNELIAIAKEDVSAADIERIDLVRDWADTLIDQLGEQ